MSIANKAHQHLENLAKFVTELELHQDEAGRKRRTRAWEHVAEAAVLLDEAVALLDADEMSVSKCSGCYRDVVAPDGVSFALCPSCLYAAGDPNSAPAA